MIKIKTGPPINAVTIPDSSSPGLPHILPRTSEISKTQAPQTADSGIIFFRSGPTSARIRCGTIRPMKLIGPANAVTAAHYRTPESAANPRTTVTFTPSPVATSSPNANVFKEGTRKNANTNPTAR